MSASGCAHPIECVMAVSDAGKDIGLRYCEACDTFFPGPHPEEVTANE